jgi:DNA replication and repair protein RecF
MPVILAENSFINYQRGVNLRPMPHLASIIITQFKNYSLSSFEFREKVVGICGLNGKGKTNLLDAIYYCCFTKSYFSRTDQLNVQFNSNGFRLESQFLTESNTLAKGLKVVCKMVNEEKKEFSVNDIPYQKLSEHIGRLPCVMIAPDDIELITGAAEGRRRYMDTILSQMNAEYLLQLIQYTRILQQRNSLLKRFAEQGKTDTALLEVMDEQLVERGHYIYESRRAFTLELLPLVQTFYSQIANNEELVGLSYESQLNQTDFALALTQNRQKDLLLQRTNTGIHKDDISILLNNQPFKSTASQGQRKSLLFALKLAEFKLLQKNKGFAPILLLDDVFEKLDDNRMNNLLHWVCNENSSQVFITDTHRERLESTFNNLGVQHQIIEL